MGTMLLTSFCIVLKLIKGWGWFWDGRQKTESKNTYAVCCLQSVLEERQKQQHCRCLILLELGDQMVCTTYKGYQIVLWRSLLIRQRKLLGLIWSCRRIQQSHHKLTGRKRQTLLFWSPSRRQESDRKCGSCQQWACKNHCSKENVIQCFKFTED
jgi:hypothetical protein